MLGPGVAAGLSARFCTFCVGVAFSFVAETGAGFGGGVEGFEQDELDGQDEGALGEDPGEAHASAAASVAAEAAFAGGVFSARFFTFSPGVVFSLAAEEDGDSDEKV